MRIDKIIPVYVEQIPLFKDMEEGKLYIAEERGFANHLCACGCGGQTPMDLKSYWKDGWELTKNQDGTISFSPSIGNWKGQNPYHAHYLIKNNKIIWC